MSDIEAVLRETLSSESLSIDPKSYSVRFHLSVFPPACGRRYHRVADSWHFVVSSQGLLRRPRYSRLLREDVREGHNRYPFVEDGIQTDMCAAGKSAPYPHFISRT